MVCTEEFPQNRKRAFDFLVLELKGSCEPFDVGAGVLSKNSKH